MEIINIEKGMDVNFIHETKFNTSIICMLVRRPLSREEATLNALLVNILKSGCRRYQNIEEINNHLDEMYGAVFSSIIVKKGEEQILQFYIDVLNESVETGLYKKAVHFLKSIAFEPLTDGAGFLEEIFTIEKENLKQHIKNRINDKSEYLKLKTLEKTCEGEPFGIYADGYYEDIDKIDRISLYNHYKSVIETSHVEIFTLTDNRENLAYLEKDFALDRNVVKEVMPKPSESAKKSISRYEETMDTNQGKLCISVTTGIPAFGKDFAALLVLNEILGGSGNSKLFLTVREKHGLCYNINSFVYRFKGIMMIQCGVEKENIEKTILLIQEIVQQMKEKGANGNEIQLAKINIINSLDSISDYPSGLIDFYGTQKLAGDKNSIEEFINVIHEVSEEDIAEAAAKMEIHTVYSLA